MLFKTRYTMPHQLPLLAEERLTDTTQRDETERAGFRDAWRRRDYAVTPALRAGASVVAVVQRLPERVVQEDADLLMYYDNALMRSETA